jgi:hypothetical protein
MDFSPTLFCIGQNNKTGVFMKRKVFLALALFALMAVGLYAQTEADFEVDSDGKSVSIISYKGSATVVNIPAKIKNLPVTEIEDKAFLTSKITSVTIPASVTSIGSGAFENCSFLTSVTFAGSIPSSGFKATAFRGVGDIRDKYLSASGGIGTYTRPSGIATATSVWTKSASAAATGTSGLAFALTKDGKGYSVSKGTVTKGDVVIPDTYNNLPVTEIATNAFASVPDITSVVIPNSVTNIGSGAFSACKGIRSITIGSGVKGIDSMAFNGCQDLTSVTFQSTIPALSFHDLAGFQGDLRAKYLAAGGGIGTYTRPDSKSTTWTKK